MEGTVGFQLGQALAQSKAKFKDWADIQEWHLLWIAKWRKMEPEWQAINIQTEKGLGKTWKKLIKKGRNWMELTIFDSTTFVGSHWPQMKGWWNFIQNSLWAALGPSIDVTMLHFGYTAGWSAIIFPLSLSTSWYLFQRTWDAK